MHSWPLAQSDSDGWLPDDLISAVTERLNRHFQFHLRAHEGDDAQNLEVQPLRFCGRVQKEIKSSAAVDHFISHLFDIPLVLEMGPGYDQLSFI